MAGNSQIRIDSILPPAAIPGGYVEVRGHAIAGDTCEQPQVSVGGAPGRLVFSSPTRMVVSVPAKASSNQIRIHSGGMDSPPVPFLLGRLLVSDLHPVANPAVDRFGNVLTTQSGPRGKKTPISVFKIAGDGTSVTAFLKGIVNATGLIFRSDGTLLVSSRHDGTIYEVSPTGEMEVFAQGMGIATGLAIDGDENVYVGDRTGTVFKISPDRKIFVFATLEPSVAAYHMASSPDGGLFVTAPTTSSFDSIFRIDPNGVVKIWRRGFGRPQGIAFDDSGRLYVCASYRGQRGVFRLTGPDEIEQVVAGQGIVGLAFAPDGTMVIATGSSVYRIPRLD